MSRFNRRWFLGTSAALLWAGTSPRLRGEGRPPVDNPRATSGDDVYEPNWTERLTVTVGPKKADLVGDSDKVIQAAVEYVARLGGGTVHVLPGTYRLRNAVVLQPRVRLLGSGAESLLKKEPSVETKIAADSDWYDQEITLADASGFQVGDGVCLRTRDPHNGGVDVLKRTLVARDGNRFKLDKPLRENFWLSGEPTCASLFPLLTGEQIHNVVIENITLDGNRENNANLDGNYAGCIFIQDSNRWTIRGVTARNYNGDGVSWQICHDVVVENCHSHDNAGLGLHPGSGSQRPLIVGNRIERNNLGLYFCWGVKYGLAEKNVIDGNETYGVSIGHNDTDNIVRDNTILNSGVAGVLFRDDDRGQDFWANRNRVENNRIVDSGGPAGIGIDVQGKTRDIVLRGNELRETRGQEQRIGIRIGSQVGSVTLAENTIEGFAAAVQDERRSA